MRSEKVMDRFWFYDVDLKYDFCGVNCSEKELVKVVESLTGSKDVPIDTVRAHLRDLACLQKYMIEENLSIIESRKYAGESDVVVVSGQAFYIVSALGAELHLTGLECGTIREYATIVDANDLDILNEYIINGINPSMELVQTICNKFIDRYHRDVGVTETMNIFNSEED